MPYAKEMTRDREMPGRQVISLAASRLPPDAIAFFPFGFAY